MIELNDNELDSIAGGIGSQNSENNKEKWALEIYTANGGEI